LPGVNVGNYAVVGTGAVSSQRAAGLAEVRDDAARVRCCRGCEQPPILSRVSPIVSPIPPRASGSPGGRPTAGASSAGATWTSARHAV
jgi:hypothetical protein